MFVRLQSFSVKTFDRSRSGCQVIRLGAGNDFRGPSGQALPLPLRVSFSRARFFLCPLLQAPATQPRPLYSIYPVLAVEDLNVSDRYCLNQIDIRQWPYLVDFELRIVPVDVPSVLVLIGWDVL